MIDSRGYSDIDYCIVSGKVFGKPEYRAYDDSRGWCEFTIGITTSYNKNQQFVSYLKVSVFGARAVRIAKKLQRGMHVIVTGRLMVRQYEASGIKQISPELRAESIRPLTSWNRLPVPSDEEPEDIAASVEVTTDDEEGIPF